MTAQCWLHTDSNDIHDVDLIEGWWIGDGQVIPVARRCARRQGPGQDYRRRPATEITVWNTTDVFS